MGYREKSPVTKTQISKAGKQLVDDMFHEESLRIVNEFRYSHEQITKELLTFISKNPLVKISSRRLKRTPAIIHKIRRSILNDNSTELYKMQDIGGCRCVFNNIGDIYTFIDYLSKNLKNFEFVRIYDYIKRGKDTKGPKEDGYRGVHIVYKYSGDNDYLGLYVELQLRTKLQHSRATAVEIIDVMNESKIKFGEGEKKYKDFFKWASVIFENSEGIKTSARNKAKAKINKILKEQDVIRVLKSRIISYDFVGRFGRQKWNRSIQGDMILEITQDGNNVEVKTYYDKTLQELKSLYLSLEKEFYGNISKDIVYLSSSEIENAYPNYVGDASNFINSLNSFL